MSKRVLLWVTVGGYIEVDDDVTVDDVYERISEDEFDVLNDEHFEVTTREWDVWE